MKNFIRQHKFISLAAILAILVAAYLIYSSTSSTQVATKYAVTPASKQTLVVSVSGSGQISAVSKIDIKPQSGSTQSANTVTSVNVQQSQDVKAGQLIATLDQRNASLSINQAKAAAESAQANYDKLLAGPTSLDLQTNQNQINSAQLSLNSAKQNLDNVKRQQQTTVNNALTSYLNVDTNPIPSPGNYSSTGTPTVSGSYSGTTEGSYVISIFGNNQFSVGGLESGSGSVMAGLIQPVGTHGLYVQFGHPDSVKTGDSWTIYVPNHQADSYLSLYNSYQTALQNQTQALVTAQNSVDSAQANLDSAKTSLAQKQAPATAADIAASKSQLDNANAQLQTAYNNYNNNIITAPFDGRIAALNVQKGDQINASTILATLVTNQQMAEISLNEVDVASVKVGQKATLTFDALPDLTLTGKVSQVDVIGTVTQGVVSYGVKVNLDSQDDRIKPGMSVNVSIITNVVADVLAVPSGAVKNQNGQSYIQVLNSVSPKPTAGQQTQVTSAVAPTLQAVTVGISNDTMTQITEGLNDGDIVVVQTINSSAASTSGTSGTSGAKTGSGGGGGVRVFGL